MKPSIHKLFSVGVLSAAVVFSAGCQTFPSSWGQDVGGRIDTDLEQTRVRNDKAAAVPGDVSKALLPPLEIALPEGKAAPLDSRFDISVSAAPVRQVLMGLVEGTPYDVVVQPSVSGTVTLALKDVTVPEAFKALRDTYGYEYRREGNRFFVLGREMQTRVFNINYLNLIRKGRSDTRVTATGLNTTGNSSGTANTGGGGSTTSQTGVEISTESQSDFWKDMQSTLIALVGNDGGRKVIINPQTGVAVVRAMPDELRLVQDYLDATHLTADRQVVLEAKIIEVELNDGFQSGINWSKVNGNYTFGQTGGGTALNGSGVSDTAGETGNVNPTIFSAVNGTLASAFGGIFSLAVKSGDFGAFLELLKSQGQLQVLSSPRVSTVNNQKAVIKVGVDEFFVVSQTVTPSATVGVAPTITTALAPFFSGISLDVTPQIDENGNINMHIHPSVSDISPKNITTGSSTPLTTALSSVRESDNMVRAQSGQIIVIGGLMKEGSTDDNASVPFLGDVPLLGNLFKQKKITRIKKELVILLKPTIMKIDEDWDKAVGESQDRIKKLGVGS